MQHVMEVLLHTMITTIYYFVQYMKLTVIQCNVQKFLQVSSLRNMNSFYIFTPHFYYMNSNIILPSSLLNVLILWPIRLLRFPLSAKANFYTQVNTLEITFTDLEHLPH